MKKKQLKDLYQRYCSQFSDKEIVLGYGNEDARIILIGEAPGKDEVRLGKPFVGASGKNLEEFIGNLNIKREELFITNTIKYRLSKVNEKTGRLINRPALKDEIISSRKYLIEELITLVPEYIVTLGNVALRSITGDFNNSIGNCHGELISCELEGKCFKVFPLYHPASIIYNSKLRDVYLQDLVKFRNLINT